MEICDTRDKAFIDIANILLSKEVQREFGWPVSVEPGTKFLYNGYGFVSFRFKDDIYYFDYGYIFPQFRGHGEYKRLFLQREVICGGKLCKINTKNPIVKIFLLKNHYQIIKETGSWTYFQKHL